MVCALTLWSVKCCDWLILVGDKYIHSIFVLGPKIAFYSLPVLAINSVVRYHAYTWNEMQCTTMFVFKVALFFCQQLSWKCIFPPYWMGCLGGTLPWMIVYWWDLLTADSWPLLLWKTFNVSVLWHGVSRVDAWEARKSKKQKRNLTVDHFAQSEMRPQN